MIDASNFCHIENVGPGVNVLFFVEHDGDEVVLHQVTVLDIGTMDLKVSISAEKFEALWPDKIRFADAAQKVIATAAELGFGARAGTVAAPASGSLTEGLK